MNFIQVQIDQSTTKFINLHNVTHCNFVSSGEHNSLSIYFLAGSSIELQGENAIKVAERINFVSKKM